jgi:transcriptional regulator with XRE-family HTH domain
MSSRPRFEHHFSYALKQARALTGHSQEDFDVCSSRTYISALERGLKIPTLSKVDQLAKVMGVHPLVILAMAYAKEPTPHSVQDTLHHAAQQAWSLMDHSKVASDER